MVSTKSAAKKPPNIDLQQVNRCLNKCISAVKEMGKTFRLATERAEFLRAMADVAAAVDMLEGMRADLKSVKK